MRNPVGQLLVWYGRVYLVVERRRNWASLVTVQGDYDEWLVPSLLSDRWRVVA